MSSSIFDGATLFPLPPGDKDPPPKGVTGKGASLRLNPDQRAALAPKPPHNIGLLLGRERVQMRVVL